MTRTGTAGLLLVAFAVLGATGVASAQTQIGGFGVEGSIESGVRFFVDEPKQSHRAKLEEYRDLGQGLALQQLQLRFFRPDDRYAIEFSGRNWGRQDQEFSLRTGRLGLWQFGFDWDQMRHVFSTNARMLETESSRGVFTLPATRPAQADYNSARKLDEISVRWDTARVFFRLSPTPDLELKAEYTRINKDGDRPMGVPFSFNFVEVLEPIEHTVHDFRLGATLAREQWQLQFGYTASFFLNDVKSLTADNPFQATDTATAASAGRMSLPPDNQAHTFNLAGGANLPWWRTRVNTNFSYSLRLQNDDFLPHTRNPNISSDDTALPQGSLHGNVQIFLVNVNATSRPLPPLTLSAKYRLYDYNDWSDVIQFNNWVETDTTRRTDNRRAGRWSFGRHNFDIDGRWQILQPLAFTLGAGWERWDRNDHREVQLSNEAFGKAVLDVTPFDWLLVRTKYTPSVRRYAHYDPKAHEAHSAEEPDVTATAGQSHGLRKFDEGDRDRHRVDLLVQLMPTDTFTVTPTVGYRHDDYVESKQGLQQEVSWSAGTDLNWAPLERVSLSAGYMHELIFQKQRSRYRSSTATDVSDFDWISVNTDTVDTVHVGATVTLIPKVLDWIVSGNYSTALGRIETRNVVEPTSGTATDRERAKARPFPAFEDNLLRVETALKYYFWKSWTTKLGYVFESFDKHDWRTDTLNPFIPGQTSAIWLGNDQKNYDAHIIGATLTYKFK